MLAIKNVRGLGRGAPVTISGVTTKRGIGVSRVAHLKDHQLFRILLVDVGVYLIFTSMLSVVLTYQQIVTAQSQGTDEGRIRGFYALVSVFNGYIPSCIWFYSNLLVSATFRHEAKKVLMFK